MTLHHFILFWFFDLALALSSFGGSLNIIMTDLNRTQAQNGLPTEEQLWIYQMTEPS